MISEKNMGGEIIKQPEEEKKLELLLAVLERKLENMRGATDNDAANFLSPEAFEELVRVRSNSIKAEQNL